MEPEDEAKVGIVDDGNPSVSDNIFNRKTSATGITLPSGKEIVFSQNELQRLKNIFTLLDYDEIMDERANYRSALRECFRITAALRYLCLEQNFEQMAHDRFEKFKKTIRLSISNFEFDGKEIESEEMLRTERALSANMMRMSMPPLPQGVNPLNRLESGLKKIRKVSSEKAQKMAEETAKQRARFERRRRSLIARMEANSESGDVIDFYSPLYEIVVQNIDDTELPLFREIWADSFDDLVPNEFGVLDYPVVLNANESSSYAKCIDFMFKVNSDTHWISDEEFKVIKGTRILISYLRSLEANPADVEENFLNRIDTMLALLVYHIPSDNNEEFRKLMSMRRSTDEKLRILEAQEDDGEFNDATEALNFAIKKLLEDRNLDDPEVADELELRNSRLRAISGAALVLFILAMATFGTWAGWESNTTYDLEKTYQMLSEQVADGGVAVAEEVGLFASMVSFLLYQFFLLGKYSAVSVELDRFLVRTLTKFQTSGISGLHIVENAALVGAFVDDQGIIKLMQHSGGPSDCICVYDVLTDGSRNATSETCGTQDCGISNRWSSTTLSDGDSAWSASYVLPGSNSLGKTFVTALASQTVQFSADITLSSLSAILSNVAGSLPEDGISVLIDADVDGNIAASSFPGDKSDGTNLVKAISASSATTAEASKSIKAEFGSFESFELNQSWVDDELTYAIAVPRTRTAVPVIALGVFATNEYISTFVYQKVVTVVFLVMGLLGILFLARRFWNPEDIESNERSSKEGLRKTAIPVHVPASPRDENMTLPPIPSHPTKWEYMKDQAFHVLNSIKLYYSRRRLRRDVMILCVFVVILVNGIWNISSDDVVENVTLDVLKLSASILSFRTTSYINQADKLTTSSFNLYETVGGNTMNGTDLIAMMLSFSDNGTEFLCDRMMVNSGTTYQEVSTLTTASSGLVFRQKIGTECLESFLVTEDYLIGDSLGVFDCSFNVSSELWYQQAISGKPGFTSTYIRNEDSIPVIASVYPIDSDVFVGAEVSLSDLTQVYKNFEIGFTYSYPIITYLFNRTSVLSASSEGSIIQYSISGDVLLLNAQDSSNANVSESSQFLTERGLDRIDVPTEIKTALDRPITWAIPITLGSGESASASGASSPFILVALVNYWDFLGNLDRVQTIATVYSFGSIVVLLYIGLIAFRLVAPVQKSSDTKELIDKAIETFGAEIPTHQRLQEMASEIKAIILDASTMSWARRRVDKGSLWLPVPLSDMKQHSSQRAKMHILDSQNGMDVISMCFLETRKSMIPLYVYKFTCSVYYRLFLQFTLVLHIILAFFDWSTNADLKENGYKENVVVLSALCLCVEGFEVFTRILRTYYWNAVSIISWVNREHEINIAMLIVWLLLCINWILTVGASFSFEYVFPIRALLLILFNSKIRSGFLTFFKTIIAAKDVFLVYFCLVITGASMGLVLFRKTVNEGEVENSFDNFIRSMATSFVFISTAENITEVLYQAVDASPFYVIYFIGYALMGMFFVVAMVIGTFQEGFSDLQREQLRLQKLYDRTGIIAAFILLDVDSSGELSQSEFAAFIKTVRPKLKMSNIKSYFKEFNKDNSENLDLFEFVNGIEKVSLSQLLSPLHYKPDWRLWLRINVFESQNFHRVVMILLILQIWLLTLYGLDVSETTIDLLSALIMIFFSIEMTLKAFVVFGPTEFFWYSKYHINGREKEFIHRFDFLIVFISAIGFIATRAAVGSLVFTDDEDNLRFVLTIPVLRIFSHTTRTRRLVYTFFRIVPIFASLVTLMSLTIYVFGVIGVRMFKDKFSEILEADRRPDGNFDTLGNAVLVLFQMLTGEAWDDVMYAAVLATDWTVAWYFIAYTILVTTLFSNLLVGVILSVFSIVLEKENMSQKEIEQLLLDEQE